MWATAKPWARSRQTARNRVRLRDIQNNLPRNCGTRCYTLTVHAAVERRLAVYKTKVFARFARKAGIRDTDLWEAAHRANEGLIDADLGGRVIKQHIARTGEGRSGGSRCIVLFEWNAGAVFVYGFEKKDRENIKPDELEAFRELGEVVLGYKADEMRKRVADGVFIEILPYAAKGVENA